MVGNIESSRPILEISLLGKFRATIDGVLVDEKRWARRSALSLVKLLALKPFHSLHREQVMESLWAEESPETALNNLNKAIHAARRALEPDLAKGSDSRFILTSKNQILLDSPGRLRVDLNEFERFAADLLRNNNLETGKQAIELYRGDLLSEDIYEDWIYLRRESVRIVYRNVATKLVELHVARNEQTESIELLKELVAEDPADEYAQRLLMRCYAETGNKYQALKQFEQCRSALKTLGTNPETETIRLEQSIKSGEILLAGNAKPASAKTTNTPTPHITQLTFQSGVVRSAHFLPDPKRIIYSADWNGEGPTYYTLDLETDESNLAGPKNADIFSVSSNGEIAAALNPRYFVYQRYALLARLPINGGDPLDILGDVSWADWNPLKDSDSSDEQSFVIVRHRDSKHFLEFPIGNVIFETGGYISSPRFSPDGRKISFIEHPLGMDDRGRVVLFDIETAEKRVLTETWISIQGLAWSNDEIWFTAAHNGNARMIRAVDLNGQERSIYKAMGRLTLQDATNKGEALVTDVKIRIQTACRIGDGTERDLSWHDWTMVRDVSDDGETFLFEEAGLSGGSQLSAYIRKTDGSSVKKIADGSALVFSPDGKYALVRFHDPHNQLALVPTRDGEIKLLDNDPQNPLIYDVFANFFPDGERILFSANIAGAERRIFIQDTNGSSPIHFSPDEKAELLSAHPISPDGQYVILTAYDDRLLLCRVSDGRSSRLKGLDEGFWLIRWAADGENIYVWRREGIPAVIYKYNLANGTKEEWLTLRPKDTTGVYQITGIRLTPDGTTYAYSYTRESSDLYLMKDLV